MPVDKKELERAYVQLRRIAEHREVGAEKEIRRIYKALLADLKQFIGAEYADKGNLTYEILQAKGEYARFLEEIQRRCDNITPKMEREITALVDEVYRAVYDGAVAAVQKAADPERLDAELYGLQSATPETIKRAVENPVAGLTLKDTLEKRRQEIIYDVKRNIGVGLTNGDRVDTMARRISQSLDGDYKKSVRIARTETHRVRESGMHDAARQVDDAIKDSGAGMRMVKTWRTMKDERVRPNHRVKTKRGWKTYVGGKANHQRMEGVTVLADEQFTLSDGSKTDAPGNSGVASQDINCRCFVEYSLMTDEEFFKATGRHFPIDKSGESGIINLRGGEMYRNKSKDKIEPMPKKQLNKIVKSFKKNGGQILMNNDVTAHLVANKAEGVTWDAKTILLVQNPGRAAVFEELIHAAQYRDGKNDGTPESRIKCEIEAQEKLLKCRNAYKLTKSEIEQTQKAYNYYIGELKKLVKSD